MPSEATGFIRVLSGQGQQTRTWGKRVRGSTAAPTWNLSLERAGNHLERSPPGREGERRLLFGRPGALDISHPTHTLPLQRDNTCTTPADPSHPAPWGGTGAATHRENGLLDVGIPLVLPERGPGERACEAHAGHCQMG